VSVCKHHRAIHSATSHKWLACLAVLLNQRGCICADARPSHMPNLLMLQEHGYNPFVPPFEPAWLLISPAGSNTTHLRWRWAVLRRWG
jgi:hypothetical protein